jgi:hypothetical protein
MFSLSANRVAPGNVTVQSGAVMGSAETAGADRYDASKLDFKTPPVVLSGERHTGPFAAIKPLDPSPVTEIRLDVSRHWNTESCISIWHFASCKRGQRASSD